MIVVRYSLSLQCDFCQRVIDEEADFLGKDKAHAHQQAKDTGWKIYQSQGKAKCPACVSESNGR